MDKNKKFIQEKIGHQHLTDWYKEPEDGKPKALHYTEGGPWFKDKTNCEYAKEWTDMRDEMFRKIGIV